MALTKVVFDMASGVEAADAAILKSDQTGTLTVGYDVTTFNAGTQSSGTFTPAPASGNIQRAVNVTRINGFSLLSIKELQ